MLFRTIEIVELSNFKLFSNARIENIETFGPRTPKKFYNIRIVEFGEHTFKGFESIDCHLSQSNRNNLVSSMRSQRAINY